MSDLGPFDVHIVSHTHWDREWYLPFGRFRQRLVALVDELLDAPPKRSAFLLDGQAVLIDDYLEVRPEREHEFRDALARGVLEAGPWFVLADELLASGEALTRNLLAGRRTVRARGGDPPPVLYCPDSFGHPADLPTLAEGFGLSLIILWRGLGGPAWPGGDTFVWRAPGGARALVHHLPPHGYEYGANLPANETHARERWRALRDILGARARTKSLLVLNGADHHARQSRLDESIDVLTFVAKPDRVHSSTLEAFAASFVEGATGIADLPVLEGELRFSPGYTWTVPGTWSSRAYQKRRNARLERSLTREAEPWSAIAAARGGRSRAPLLRVAWRTLLECHPHDTLCGCSIDDVAMAADARFTAAGAEARGIVGDALLDIVGHDSVSAHVSSTWLPHVLVHNAAARSRRGVAEVELARFIVREPVGPGSAGIAVQERALPLPTLDGGRIPLQVLSRRTRSDRVESPRHYPRGDRVEVARCVAWIDDVPGYGVTPVQIGDAADSKVAPPPVAPVRATPRSLSNDILRVEVGNDGTVQLESKRHERSWTPLIRFEDVGDAGDLYTHSSIAPTIHDARLIDASMTSQGPLRGQLHLRFMLDLPVSSNREGRSGRVRRNSVDLLLTLDAGSTFLRVGVRGVNRVRDHRLRMAFATKVTKGVTIADGMFAPVARETRVQPPDTRSMELIPPTAPLARWVCRQGASHGMALISDGLGEYEILDDGAIAVTLLRAVGHLSRNDLPERPGHAGWPVPTPAAQCLGPYRAEFAILPHGGEDDAIVEIERAADDVLLPVRGSTLRSATRSLDPVAGLTLEGDALRFLACKPSEDGEWTVLRCVNVTSQPARGSWRCSWPVREARSARLDEHPETPLVVREEGIVDVRVAAHAVVTVLVR
jgi:alpha-mannosidase